MTYGYTIADSASRIVFLDAVNFIVEKLQYKPFGEKLEDVDGSLYQRFTNGQDTVLLESNVNIDYVAIKSNVKLPIQSLKEGQE